MPDLQQETTELLQRLIRFDTVNPPGNERAAQEFLRRYLEDGGLRVRAARARPRPPEPRRAPARRAPTGPTLGYLGHVDTVLADAGDWTLDPWSGELRDGCVWGRGALDMKSQVAAEIAAACALAEEGWRPESGELLVIVTADEEAGGDLRRAVALQQVPDKVRCDFVAERGRRRRRSSSAASALLPSAWPRRACSASRSPPTASAGHASIPRIGDNALIKMAPLLEALARPAAGARALARARGVHARARASTPATSTPRSPSSSGATRASRVLLEPTLGVTFAPTMIAASREDQRDPRARGAAGRLPRAARARRGPRAGADRRGDRRRTATSSSSTRGRGQPLAARDAADGPHPRLRRREDPGAARARRAARLHRLALVPRGVPRLRRVRLLPPPRRWTCSRQRR